MQKRKEMREWLKDTIRLNTDFDLSDQHQGLPMPPTEKPPATAEALVALPAVDQCPLVKSELRALIGERHSQRKFREQPISLHELSWLLWATQGVRRRNPERVLRNVPSAGNRHSFESYLAVFRVDGLEEGIYRYLPLEHALVLESRPEDLVEKLAAAALDQRFIAQGAVAFIWTTLPYRMEWRYLEASAKVIALDAGHVCQNLYLAAEAIACGTCAIAAYHQEKADALLGLDGEEEFVLYMAPVGKV